MDVRHTASDKLLQGAPVLDGHFLLESGLHTDRWFSLNALFLEPAKVSPYIDELAQLILPFQVTAVCGPLLGGAFVAQAVASRLNIRFYYSTPAHSPTTGSLFGARYDLPKGLAAYAENERVALVDAPSALDGRCAPPRIPFSPWVLQLSWSARSCCLARLLRGTSRPPGSLWWPSPDKTSTHGSNQIAPSVTPVCR